MTTPAPGARERLVAAADRLFYAEGFRAVGIDRVLAESGAAKATLYAHFPSKDDLILAVLERREEEVAAYFAAAVARHRRRVGHPVEAFFAALAEWFKSPGFRGCAFQNAAVELVDPAHPGAAFARASKSRFNAMLAGLVHEGAGAAGAAQAPAVAVLVHGAIIAALMERSAAPAAVARDAAMRLLGEPKFSVKD